LLIKFGVIPLVHNSALMPDKLHNALYVSSSAAVLWRQLRFVAETCSSIKTMHAAVSWK